MRTIFICCFVLIVSISQAQDTKYKRLYDTLTALTEQIPALDVPVTISVTNVSVQEFLRGVANKSGLNIDVEPEIDYRVINNFNDVKVKDVLVFICQQFSLDIKVIGNIITIYQEEIEESPEPEKVSIEYDRENDLFTLDYNNKSIDEVVKEITTVTGYNVILSPGIGNITVSGYIQKKPFEQAIDKFAYTNNLEIEKTEDNFYLFKQLPKVEEEPATSRQRDQANNTSRQLQRERSNTDGEYALDIQLMGSDSLMIFAMDAPLMTVIEAAAEELDVNFVNQTEMKNNVSLFLSGVSFEEMLNHLLKGSEYLYKKIDGVYLLGDRSSTRLKEYKSIRLEHRTIDKIIDFLPGELVGNMEIIEFPENNSLFVGGSSIEVVQLENFIEQIDKIVPVILIEIIIVDMNKSIGLQTGVEMQLGDEPRETKGQVFPGIDMTYSSESINKLLNSIDGFSSLNLGNLTPNFYATLKALETQGVLNLRSTPKLSTLNGHEATMSIGNTEYYLETQSEIVGSDNPIQSRSEVYKSLEATLAVTIKPFVSGDEQITMEIDVEQSDFTERISEFAPPGRVSRNFQSMIRVRNQETVLLGGLEEKRTNDSSSGLPLLARIPILKWFFSSQVKDDSKSKLNIFIKPTIIG